MVTHKGFWKCPSKLDILNLKCQYYNLPLLNKSKLVDVQFESEQFNTKEVLGKEPQKVNYFYLIIFIAKMVEKDNLEILSKKLKYKNNGMKQRIYNWSQDTLTNDNTNMLLNG